MLASLITGPISSSLRVAAARRSRNVSYTPSKTTILLAAAHR